MSYINIEHMLRIGVDSLTLYWKFLHISLSVVLVLFNVVYFIFPWVLI